MAKMPYTSKTISLHDDTWATLECLRKEFGSYSKVIKHLLTEKGSKVSKRDKKKEELK